VQESTYSYDTISTIIIISLLMSYWGTGLPYGLLTRRTGHNSPSADWWVLTTANATGTNSLTFLPKHGARDNKFLVTHPMTDQRCLASTTTRQALLEIDCDQTAMNYHLSRQQNSQLTHFGKSSKLGLFIYCFIDLFSMIWSHQKTLTGTHKVLWLKRRV
jgi:hypothetical protein